MAELGVGGSTDSWKTFWIAAGLSIGVRVIKIVFIVTKKVALNTTPKSGAFLAQAQQILARKWKIVIYYIIPTS